MIGSSRQTWRPLRSLIASQSRLGHTVRVIVREDLPGKAYTDDVLEVKAGYARNFLIPQKKAVYATRQNFERLQIKDPQSETAEERRARLLEEAKLDEDVELKAADLLRNYLRNKTLKIWRNVDSTTEATTPGMVDAKAVRKKLSKQLKIDLELHEAVHLRDEPLVGETSEEEVTRYMQELGDPSEKCKAEIRRLGLYLARISLKGGHSIPLKVEVVKR